MPTRLLQTLAAHARWTVIVVVAVLAGATGGVWAATVGPSPTVTVTNVADGDTPGDRATGKPEKTKPVTPPKRDADEEADELGEVRAERADGQGAHGACVSAVARGDAVGGKNNNHGGAVSEAARTTCRSAGVQGRSHGKADLPHGKAGTAPGKAAKPTKPAKPTERGNN